MSGGVSDDPVRFDSSRTPTGTFSASKAWSTKRARSGLGESLPYQPRWLRQVGLENTTYCFLDITRVLSSAGMTFLLEQSLKGEVGSTVRVGAPAPVERDGGSLWREMRGPRRLWDHVLPLWKVREPSHRPLPAWIQRADRASLESPPGLQPGSPQVRRLASWPQRGLEERRRFQDLEQWGGRCCQAPRRWVANMNPSQTLATPTDVPPGLELTLGRRIASALEKPRGRSISTAFGLQGRPRRKRLRIRRSPRRRRKRRSQRGGQTQRASLIAKVIKTRECWPDVVLEVTVVG